MYTTVGWLVALGIIAAIAGFIWWIQTFHQGGVWIIVLGLILFLVAWGRMRDYGTSLIYASQVFSFPAQVIWSNDKELLMRFGSKFADKSDQDWLVDRPEWLQSKNEPATDPAKVGQTWIIKEWVRVADKEFTQPILVTYTAPAPGKL